GGGRGRGVPARRAGGDERDGGGVGRVLGQVAEGQVGRGGARRGDLRLGEHALLDEGADLLLVAVAVSDGCVDRGDRELTADDEDLGQGGHATPLVSARWYVAPFPRAGAASRDPRSLRGSG